MSDPTGWGVAAVRDFAASDRHSFIDGDWIESPYIASSGIRLIQTGNIGVGRFVDKNKKFISEKSFTTLKCKDVFAGDILICRLADPIGRSCIVPNVVGRAITSVDVCILRVDEDRYCRTFVAHALNQQAFLLACLEKSGGSTRQRISRTNLGAINVPVPRFIPEQSKIAEVLSTVDRAIERTEALIAKQQRIKTGMMQDLLTRGIDEHGNLRSEETHEFKDSPLGRIPVEWDVCSLEGASHAIVDCPHTTPRFEDAGVFVVRTFNVKNGRITGCRSFVSEHEYAERVSRLEPQAEDVIFTREAPVGEAFVVPEGLRVCLGQRTMLIRCDQLECLPGFLVEIIYSQAMRLRFDRMVGGTTNPHLNVGDVRALQLALPPVAEQEMIRDAIAAIRSAIDSDSTAVKKLRALKTGLMQDLLTGKVPVTPLLEKQREAVTA